MGAPVTAPVAGPPGVGLVGGCYVIGAVAGVAVDRDRESPGNWLVYPWRGGPLRSCPAADLALDLSGPLDFGTRAAFALQNPEFLPPLTAPSWTREPDSAGILCWGLSVEDEKCGPTRFTGWPQHVNDEPDPRRALALALAALAGRRP